MPQAYTATIDGKDYSFESANPPSYESLTQIRDYVRSQRATSSTAVKTPPPLSKRQSLAENPWQPGRSSQIEEPQAEKMQVGPVSHTYSRTGTTTGIRGRLAPKGATLRTDIENMPENGLGQYAGKQAARLAFGAMEVAGFGTNPEATSPVPDPMDVLGKIAGPLIRTPLQTVLAGQAMTGQETYNQLRQGNYAKAGVNALVGSAPGIAHGIGSKVKLPTRRATPPAPSPSGEYAVPVDPRFAEPALEARPAVTDQPLQTSAPEPPPAPIKSRLKPKGGKLTSGIDPTGGRFDESPAVVDVPKATNAAKPYADAARNAIYENLSALRRVVPESWDKVVNYATSAQQATERAQALVPQVLDHLADADTKARFQPMLVADRIFNHVEALKERLATASPEEVAKIRAEGRKVNPPIDPVTGERITEPDLASYMDRPDVVKAIQAHKELVEPLLEQNQVDVGADPNGVRGKYSEAFTPAIAADEDNLPMRAGTAGGNLRKPLMRNPVAPGTQRFTGSADFYLNDYGEAIGNRLYHGSRAANAVKMWQQLLHDGVAVDAASPGSAVAGDGKMVFDGRPVDSKVVNIESTFGRKINGLPENVRVPSEVVKEMQPVHESVLKTHVSDALQRVSSRLIGSYLFGTGDVISHGAAISGRAAVELPNLGNPIMRRTFETKSLSAVMDAFAGDRAPNVRLEARRIAAKYGATRIDSTAHVGAGKLLYGPNGYHTRMLEVMYRYGRKNGWNERAIGQAMQSLNTYNKALAPAAQRGVQRVGAGTFYQTGIRNRGVGYKAYTTGKGLSTLAGSLLLAAAIQRGTDPEGKWWYQRPGQKFGELYRGKDKKGKATYWNILPFINRPVGYATDLPKIGDRAIHAGAAPGQVAADVGVGAINQALGPVASGPLVGAVFASQGVAPYITSNDQHTGVGGFYQHESAKKSPFSKERLYDIGKALLPISGLEARTMTGIPAVSTRANPEKEKGIYRKGQKAGAKK